MKFTVVALALLASIPAFGQETKPSCKAYFQVLQATDGTPGLRVGMDSDQKSWWEGYGEKRYPGLCLDGSVTSGDKPRYLVIWSKSKSIGQASTAPNEIYGEPASALQATAPKEWIYQPRWDVASISVVSVLWDGSIQQAPVHLVAGRRAINVLWPNSPKMLEVAVKYLATEPAFSPKGS